MSSSNPQLLRSTIQNIFEKNDDLLRKKVDSSQIKSKVNKKQLELAVSVLLVDLASCDQSFDPEEYQVICLGLMRLFGTSKTDVTALVNQAKVELANMRGVARFATILKESLTIDERKEIMEVVEEVIMADGVEDGFETYLRNKFKNLLGLEEVQKN